MARVENQKSSRNKQQHQNGLVQNKGCEQQVYVEVSLPCGACVILGVGVRP